MKRSKRDQKKKKAAKQQWLLKRFSVALLLSVVLVVFLSLPDNPIDIAKQHYSCSHTKCLFTVVVRNADHFSHSGYIRINAFIEIARGDAISREIVASERFVFDILAGEEKIVEGKFLVTAKPKLVNFSAGQINK